LARVDGHAGHARDVTQRALHVLRVGSIHGR
jgi:hypothetical protein